jgi:hypothetical protein
VRVLVKNRALKPRRVVASGPPTKVGARPGKNEGPEWLHRPTSEHVFDALPPEVAPARSRAPMWATVGLAAVAAAVALMLAL